MRTFLLFSSLAIAACSSSSSPPPAADDASVDSGSIDATPDTTPETAAPPSVSASLRAVPNNVIGAIADVVATEGSTVTVEYGDTTAYGNAAPSVTVPASGKVSVAILGLRQKSTAHVRVRAEKSGLSAQTSDLTFATGALPFDLGDNIEIAKTSPGLTGYFLIGFANGGSSVRVYLMVDRTGRIVWYWVPIAPSEAPLGPGHFDRVHGNFLVFQDVEAAYKEIDLFGNVVHVWKDAASVPEAIDQHDLLPLEGNHALMIGIELHPFDSRPYFPGGSETALRYDNTVDEIDETGKVVFHFSTYPSIAPEELVADDNLTVPVDPENVETAHMNSVSLAPDGNIIASMRATSSAIKIDKKDSHIIWRLGGKKSDFTFVDDPEGGFSLQHDVRYIPGTNDIFLLDNGNNHTVRATRACRYTIDETAKTAKLVWSYTHDPSIFSPFAGNARYLPNGHVIVAYARQGTVTEIDPTTKEVVWELASKYFGLYRALYVPTLYP
jgi:hypothetical protein